MRIGILGSGVVARTLAGGFLKHGHEVTVGTRDPRKLTDWRKQHPDARVGTAADAASAGELLVLAVKGTAASAALNLAGAPNLEGKVIIDTTNPIADAPPDHGALRFFTSLDDSLMERLQREYPAARFVKAFNSVGNARMVNPVLKGGPPTMFICGNDEDAKRIVKAVLDQFGWETEDMGTVEAARAIEPLCILWCIPGFLRNEWTHAYKVLR
jgi:8-hydroxy-5-deazaflavin:NADPH oxidoreductase